MELFKHQQDAVDFILANHGYGALYHDIGLGKTLTALKIFDSLRALNPALKLFVICPLSLIEAAWGNDIQKFTNYVYHNIHKHKEDKPADIYIINFEGLLSEKKLPIYTRIIKNNPCLAVIDESSKIKNNSALTTKRILSLRHDFKYRIILSGTPAPNNETEYWAQMMFIMPGIFHENFYAFRNRYCHLERGNQRMAGQIITKSMAREIFAKGWKWGITEDRKKELLSKMAPVCHWRKKKDCLDLPEQIDETRDVELTQEQMRCYLQMKNYCITEIKGNAIPAPLAITKLIKLRQITSGFALTPDSEPVEFAVNPKLRELLATLDEAGEQQAIVWCQFHKEIEAILEELGDKAVSLYGETKDKDASIKDFISGKAQYLIAHPRSAGHGLTFTNCSLQIFYSLDYSWEAYEQSRGRTHRAGQKNVCVYIHLIAPGTIDAIILDVLRRKGDANELVAELLK